jgi:predicted nucleotidyltransferase
VQPNVRDLIRSALAGIHCERCVLFGSHARDDDDVDSDYDLLIIVDHPVSPEERSEIACTVRTRLAEHLIPADVLVRSSQEAQREQRLAGAVVGNALAEGVTL